MVVGFGMGSIVYYMIEKFGEMVNNGLYIIGVVIFEEISK